MSRYSQDSRDRVRDAVDMLALVGAKVELTRRGPDSYFGCCPFHDEQTPSFHVRPDEKHYHCFGCSMSGDPFSFVMETEGVDFKEALELLAERFGVKLETETESPQVAAARQLRERLYSLLDRAATYYERYLWESRDAAGARDYLLGRGLTEETLREFRVGFAPSGWDRIVVGSRRAGFSDRELVAAGLAQARSDSQGQLRDRFHERIMFPTADARGRVRGFGARLLPPPTGAAVLAAGGGGADAAGGNGASDSSGAAAGQARWQGPKYLNSAENELYRKGEVLYGIAQARGAAAKVGRMVLAEGYVDVLALHQAGVVNSVGVMGTSLTDEQVRELARVAHVVELCLDSDNAGQQAMIRAQQVCARARLELRVVNLPAGADPGDLLGAGELDRLRELVGSAVPYERFLVEHTLDRGQLNNGEGRDAAVRALAPVFAATPASALRDELILRAAARLGMTGAQLETLLARVPARLESPTPPANATPHTPPRAGAGVSDGVEQRTRPVSAAAEQRTRPVSAHERSFLAMCLAAPESGAALLNELDSDAMLLDPVLRRVARALQQHGCQEPLAAVNEDDEALSRELIDLADRAGRGGQVSAEQLQHARLLLELDRVDREIAYQRLHGASGLVELQRQRQRVLAEISQSLARLGA